MRRFGIPLWLEATNMMGATAQSPLPGRWWNTAQRAGQPGAGATDQSRAAMYFCGGLRWV